MNYSLFLSCCSLFFKQEMELSFIGLQNAGKTSLFNVVATGGYSEDMIPTVSVIVGFLSIYIKLKPLQKSFFRHEFHYGFDCT